MKIKDSIAFVTGANRGFGLALTYELLERGAATVYAGVRDPAAMPKIPGVIPVRLDVTDPAQVAAAAQRCGDVTLLINNAGIAKFVGSLDPAAVDVTRDMFDVNVNGTIRMSQAFAPILAKNGGGAIVNILSVASWIGSQQLAMYAATKAAAWGYTNGLRIQLRDQGTHVLGLHVGFMDTDMTEEIDFPKSSPQEIAVQTLAGLEVDLEEVLADEITRTVKQGLSSGIYLAPVKR